MATASTIQSSESFDAVSPGTLKDARIHVPKSPSKKSNGNGDGNGAVLKRLPSSNAMFRSMVENSPDIILTIEASGRLLYANARSEEIFGMKPDLAIGKTFRELGIPDSLCAFWSNLVKRTLSTVSPLERDFVFQSPAGLRHFEVRAVQEPIDPLSSTQSGRVIATVREATRQRMKDSEIVEVGQRLLYHTNNSPLAILEFDIQGRCLSWNHKAEEIFGLPQHDGGEPLTSCLPLIYPEDRARFQKVHDSLRSAGQASAFACARFIHRNGAVAHGEWYLSALLDDEGLCRSILCFLNDVTDRELAQQALLRSNEEQEQIILNRTTMLRRINDNLQEEIAIRSRLERELVSISEREHRRLGHDLHDGICQELAGIHFAVEAIMKQVPKDSPVRRQLKSIAEAVHRATHHTRLLSRGLAPIELENGNLIFALEELAADIQSLFQIDCVLESHAGASTFDPHICSNLYRIAQEAVQNAIKHGKASQIRIGLDCRKGEGFMTITDNGKGIHSRSDAEGNGMGLTIMKHRAELIRGSVKLLSHDGGGTLVHCFFRL